MIRAIAIALALLSCLPVAALDPINHSSDRVAVKGYDVVAYFTAGRPTKGTPEHEHEWMGARWRFSSVENRELFAANPEKYAPQYGGYCAYAVANNDTADIDPLAWTIVDGRLFLNYSPRIQGKWEKKRDEYVAQADRNWPGLKAGK